MFHNRERALDISAIAGVWLLSQTGHGQSSLRARDRDLGFNVLTGTVPTTLMSPTLQGLSLFRNQLTGTIPKEFAALTPLCEHCTVSLYLNENQLTGTIPQEYGVFGKNASYSILCVALSLAGRRALRSCCRACVRVAATLPAIT